MTLRARYLACSPAVHQLRIKERGLFSFQGRPPKGSVELDQEIRNGECGLIFTQEGYIERIAFVVLLRFERLDGMVLIQVAKANEGQIAPKLQMPATKVKDGE